MPPSTDTVQSWQGRTMVDPAGDKLGTNRSENGSARKKHSWAMCAALL
jgi:hypothetical protein